MLFAEGAEFVAKEGGTLELEGLGGLAHLGLQAGESLEEVFLGEAGFSDEGGGGGLFGRSVTALAATGSAPPGVSSAVRSSLMARRTVYGTMPWAAL